MAVRLMYKKWTKFFGKNQPLDEEGQALIEFIMFFPFLLMMYSVTMSIANSINASINQQKQTRAYFYYRLQNNSMAPTPEPERNDPVNFTTFGQHVNLWGVKLVGGDTSGKPLASCFKFNVPLGSTEGDSCEESYSNQTTQYIRVGTAYGICGATYQNENGHYVRLPNYSSRAPANTVVSEAACLVQ